MNSYITRELFQRGLEITLNSTAWQKLWTTTRNISDSHWGILFSPSYLYVHWLANHTKAYTMCINHIQEELLVFWSLEAQASTVLTFQTVQWIFHKLRNVSLKARKSQVDWSHITFICLSGRCVWVLFLFYYLPFLPFPELVCIHVQCIAHPDEKRLCSGSCLMFLDLVPESWLHLSLRICTISLL